LIISGTEPTRENFQHISLTQEGLTVNFNPYQIAPYARGNQQVHIPLPHLENILSPRILEAITLAKTNLVEATPETETATENLTD
jgi:hypothetical protein